VFVTILIHGRDQRDQLIVHVTLGLTEV